VQSRDGRVSPLTNLWVRIKAAQLGSARGVQVQGLGAFLLIFLVISTACRRQGGGSTAFEYEENGRKWAHGEVKVGDFSRDFSLSLQRKSSGQPFDIYHLVARVGSDVLPIAYVDLHPKEEIYLAYVFTVEFRSQDGKLGDVYAVLEKGGRSFNGRQYVHLGRASFIDREDESSFSLIGGLHVSEIVDGPFKGNLGLHYPQMSKIVSKPWQGLCPRFESLSFGIPIEGGASPSGTAQELCRPLNMENDLCQGEPTRPDCRPKPPVSATSGNESSQYRVENLEKLDVAQAIYALARVSNEGRIEFRSRQIKVTSADMNREWCAEKFAAVGRTIGDRRNDACVLRPTPTEPKDGFLTCAVTIGFERAQTYMEKVCNVTAILGGPSGEMVRVQVLKR
jgi:hypothetical protein